MLSSSLSRRTAVFGLLALSGCGFVPLYSQKNSLRGTIAFTTPNSIIGFRMRERLEQRLGITITPKYQLNVTLTTSAQPAIITQSGDTTRFNLRGSGNWSLKNNSGVAIADNSVATFTSYSAIGTTVATQSAETDARARLATALADMIITQLLTLPTDIAP